MNLYEKVERFVVESFTKVGKEKSIPHLKRTVYWIKQLKPDADEALLIAAVSHDIERAFRDESMEKLLKNSSDGFRDPFFLKEHSEKGSQIIADFLGKENADESIIGKVKSLIQAHETGGTEDQNLLKDADSMSYFENQIETFVNERTKELSREKVKAKFDWMFRRITSSRAKEIVKPWYDSAIKKLGY